MRILFVIIVSLLLTACAGPDHKDLSAFPKWKTVLAEEGGETGAALPDVERLPMLKRVQQKYASLTYSSDQENYGVADYWATPQEIKARGKADCEDFVRVMYDDLLKHHYPADDLAMVVGLDYATMQPHAMLKAKANGKWWVIDPNKPGKIYGADDVWWVKKYYELNDKGWQ